MTELQAIGAIGGAAAGAPGLANAAFQPGVAQGSSVSSREVVDIFELSLRRQSAEPGLRAALADPSKLADKVLASLESIRADYTSLLGQAEARLEPGPATTAQATGAGEPSEAAGAQALADRMAAAQSEIKELMWLQLNIGRVMVQEELMSKVAGRSTQNIDTLLRGQ